MLYVNYIAAIPVCMMVTLTSLFVFWEDSLLDLFGLYGKIVSLFFNEIIKKTTIFGL